MKSVWRLRQVEGLLDRLPRPDPEQAAGADRDLALDRLEAAAGGVRPGVDERGQPRARVGLGRARRAPPAASATPARIARLAHRDPRGDAAARRSVKAITSAVPMSGWVATSRQAAPTTISSGWASSRRSCTRCGRRASSVAEYSTSASFSSSEGSNWSDPRPDPAACAVDARRRRAGRARPAPARRRSPAAAPTRPCTRATPSRASTCISASPTPPKSDELHQVAAAVAFALQQRRWPKRRCRPSPRRTPAGRAWRSAGCAARAADARAAAGPGFAPKARPPAVGCAVGRAERRAASVLDSQGLALAPRRGWWHPALTSTPADGSLLQRSAERRAPEPLAARLEVRELVEARAGRARAARRLPGARRPPRRRQRASSSPHSRSGQRRSRAAQRRSSGRLRRSGRPPRSRRTPGRAGARSPGPCPGRRGSDGRRCPRSASQRDQGARDVGGLGVVDVEHPLRGARPPPGGARRPAKLRRPARTASGSTPRARQTAAAAIAFWQVVGAAQAQLVGGQQRLALPPACARRARQLARRGRRRSSTPRALPDAPTLPGRAASCQREHRDVPVRPWSAKTRSLASTVGGQRAVAVEVVGGDVEQHRRLGRERERVLQLEGGGLADDGGGRVDAARPGR